MTEAERIEKDADEYVKLQGSHDKPEITKHDYIAGATAENERLQQLIKEKESQLKKKSEAHIFVAKKLSEANTELKSAQELNRELVEVVSQLVPIAEQRLRKIVNYDMPDYYKIRSEIQSIIEHGLSLINKSK